MNNDSAKCRIECHAGDAMSAEAERRGSGDFGVDAATDAGSERGLDMKLIAWLVVVVVVGGVVVAMANRVRLKQQDVR